MKQLILRTCNADMTGYGGFVWPESGRVEAPDWKPEKCCGNGLHGLLWGEGDGALLNWADNAKWLVAEVNGDVIDLGGKVKFPAANVIFCGSRLDATEFIRNAGAKGAVVGATVTGGYGATVTGGDGATVTGGDRATVTGGDRATVTGGYGATVTGGDGAVLMFRFWDSTKNRHRFTVAYVGEKGIKENTAYRLNNKNKPVEAGAAS